MVIRFYTLIQASIYQTFLNFLDALNNQAYPYFSFSQIFPCCFGRQYCQHQYYNQFQIISSYLFQASLFTIHNSSMFTECHTLLQFGDFNGLLLHSFNHFLQFYFYFSIWDTYLIFYKRVISLERYFLSIYTFSLCILNSQDRLGPSFFPSKYFNTSLFYCFFFDITLNLFFIFSNFCFKLFSFSTCSLCNYLYANFSHIPFISIYYFTHSSAASLQFSVDCFNRCRYFAGMTCLQGIGKTQQDSIVWVPFMACDILLWSDINIFMETNIKSRQKELQDRCQQRYVEVIINIQYTSQIFFNFESYHFQQQSKYISQLIYYFYSNQQPKSQFQESNKPKCEKTTIEKYFVSSIDDFCQRLKPLFLKSFSFFFIGLSPYFQNIYIFQTTIMKNKKTLNVKLPSKDLDKPMESEKQIDNRRKTSRIKRIKEKNVVYPLSTHNKIVFITNQYGIGFKKQKLEDFDCPAHIPVQQMLKDINDVCYNQWKIHHQKLSSPPFEKLELILSATFAVIFLIVIIYFSLIVKHEVTGFQILNYIILALVGIIFVLTFYVCLSRREKEESIDNNVVQAIQQKLIQLNKNQLQRYGVQSRFKWSCHKDCLWIALNL